MKNQNKKIAVLAAVAIIGIGASWLTTPTTDWNPNAGYIPSWTEGATISATSNQQDAWMVNDGDPNSHWLSGGVVPGSTKGTTEAVTFDFGDARPVGQIHTRHWAGEPGTATATQVYLSADGKNWQNVASLDPTALHTVITFLPVEILARYLRVEHQLVQKDWNKAFLWEIKAYNKFGPYGERPTPTRGHVNFKELLGVNGYWSFGTDQYSDQLAPDGGPFRFMPVASHLRNYHDMTWDLKSPGDPIDFEKMAKGGGTPATEWLNWDREYKAWHLGAGMNVQASLQFYRFKPSAWENPRESAYSYAKAFTRHFGRKSGNGYICSIEAGNEPWEYPAEVYREILLGMAQGANDGDPSMEMFPCALQAVDPLAEKHGPWKNYIGDRITPASAKLLDGINIHCYSYVSGGDGKRRAVQPEHPGSSFWEMLNAIRWRNQNMPGKKIYLSEWGWDSDGAGEDCTHQECVSEANAAAFAIRGAMIAARLGIERATWFFHANDKTGSSLYTRSGLLGSANTSFQKKKPYYAFASLVKLVGNKYFHSVLQENEQAWAYYLGDSNGEITHLIAWRPIEHSNEFKSIELKIGKKKIKSATQLDGSSPMGKEAMNTIKSKGDKLELNLSGVPVLLEFE
jgi:hypothetical protein